MIRATAAWRSLASTAPMLVFDTFTRYLRTVDVVAGANSASSVSAKISGVTSSILGQIGFLL